MTVALLSRLTPEAAATWAALLAAALDEEVVPGPPHRDFTATERQAIEIAIVANPLPGALADLPKLRLIQSLWAGVDPLLADATIPAALPLARLIDPALGDAMAEAVAAHVLALHRQLPAYRHQQAERVWRQHHQPLAGMRKVGILGLGEMGRRAQAMLLALGFDVAGWRRSMGPAGLDALLAGSAIVVNLLPLTAETRGILNAAAFARMPRGASVINFGRGGHLVPADLIAALDSGHLDHAVLDVFGVEPLPEGDPLWRHPRVTITPHVAAETDPESAARCAAANIAAFRAGRPVAGLVDRTRGY